MSDPAGPDERPLLSGGLVQHASFGSGRVVLMQGSTAIVRFDHGLEQCDVAVLQRRADVAAALEAGVSGDPLRVLARCQAEAIVSVNSVWGVFSRSRVHLLPHQLWVCRKVVERWPSRWLIADDVGLGKTIEAGLLLWPLLSRGLVKRVLILAPASLCEQWQERLRLMFDIRMTLHSPAVDTERSDFWGGSDQVIASLQTLRMVSNERQRERQQRLVTGPPWDLLIVDEAHHLNADEEEGPTLGYRLVKKLVDNGRVRGLLFFTGTPHRGKHYGFLALLHLLRPDLFDPRRDLGEQLRMLPNVLIRNNKSTVTDLAGRALFQKPAVSVEAYAYSEAECRFYTQLTEFILSGRAYASSLSARDQRMVILLLIAMQKLAASSVAAIKHALVGRLDRLRRTRKDLQYLEALREKTSQPENRFLLEYEEAEETQNGELLAALEERIVHLETQLRLVEDEEPWLARLLEAAGEVREETKIAKIMEALETRFAGRSVLLFTEYKATQSLLLSLLIERYGEDAVAFINGDQAAENVNFGDGRVRTLRMSRLEAAERFLTGRARYLVSTEAGGEGVDLQDNCHCLIHGDLPWNPMRLHQRVGRLNRYGQRQRVEVLSFVNPETVEAQIWDKLQGKITNIMLAQSHYMEEPEDLRELVLGLASPSWYRELFADAVTIPRETLASWFDGKTARFGGREALDVVRELVGRAERFDYQQVGSSIPRLDLPDLVPFMENVLRASGRRPKLGGNAMWFNTPEAWLEDPAIQANYNGLLFERAGIGDRDVKRLGGVGHRVVDRAIREARFLEDSVALVRGLGAGIVIVRLAETLTDTDASVTSTIVGVECDAAKGHALAILRDSDLLERLNRISPHSKARTTEETTLTEVRRSVRAALDASRELARSSVSSLGVAMRHPAEEVVAVLWPLERGRPGAPPIEG